MGAKTTVAKSVTITSDRDPTPAEALRAGQLFARPPSERHAEGKANEGSDGGGHSTRFER